MNNANYWNCETCAFKNVAALTADVCAACGEDAEKNDSLESMNPWSLCFWLFVAIVGGMLATYGAMAVMMYLGLAYGEWMLGTVCAMGCMLAGSLMVREAIA